MRYERICLFAVVFSATLSGCLITMADGAYVGGASSAVVHENSENVSDHLSVQTKFFENMTVKSVIQYSGEGSQDVDINTKIENVEIKNESTLLDSGDQLTYQFSLYEYSDPLSSQQVVVLRVNDYPFSYQYDNSVNVSEPNGVLLSQIQNVSIRHESNNTFLDISVVHNSPHIFSQAVFVHTEYDESGAMLSERIANNTKNDRSPTEEATILLGNDTEPPINGTIWHYKGTIEDSDNGLSKVEFTETEDGELDVEHVEYTEIDLDTDNVHQTPSDVDRAQDRAQSAADRWLVNERAPAVLFAGIALVVAYVVVRRRS